MIFTLFLLILVTCGGGALTYLYEKEDSLLARLAAGNIIGAAIFSTVGFLLACFFGFSILTVSIALLVTLVPLLLLTKKNIQKEFKHDRQKARGKLDGANLKKILNFFYYAGIFLLLWLFFERAMIETPNGIFTGGSQNLGDLPFHLGAIFSFTEGNNFPPENPSYAFAKFTYPFLADFVTAAAVKIGAGAREAMLVQNVFFGFSLVVLLEKFTLKLTGSKLAGRLAPLLLIFSGGLGFVWFFKDFSNAPQSFFEFLWKMPNDYTIGEIISTKNTPQIQNFRWGNSLVVLFLTQRSLLFGLPLTLIALGKLWEIFTAGRKVPDEEKISAEEQDKKPLSVNHFPLSIFCVGLLAGTLPLIHVHSLAVLFVVSAFLFFFRLDKWKEWIAFAAGVSIIAVPELLWALSGSASDLSKFIQWHFGWDRDKQNVLAFWAKNTGLFILLLIAGLYLIATDNGQPKDKGQRTKDKGQRTKDKQHSALLMFYLPFAFLFVISNTVKLAPWEWDNIKVLIYWFVGSLPFVAYILAWGWERNNIFKAATAVCLIVLTFSGALDIWRTVTAQINNKVFDRDAVNIAKQIKQKTPPRALFLNAPTYNSAVVLSGRRSLMRYNGHLSSYGIDYEQREREVKQIYEGTVLADRLLEKNAIEYVIISPEEFANVTVNQEFFKKFPLVAEAGQYRVYKIR